MNTVEGFFKINEIEVNIIIMKIFKQEAQFRIRCSSVGPA